MPNFKAANYPDANSGYGDPWTPEGKERLYELRQQYKIPWQEFQEASCPSTALRFHVDWSCHEAILSKTEHALSTANLLCKLSPIRLQLSKLWRILTNP